MNAGAVARMVALSGAAKDMWQARPIFVSSTFLDMQAERDYLRTRVFPELKERLRSRRHHLEWVDLRVGVAAPQGDDEGLRELQVLKVCLEEVRRCRPFLIVLLGDRYGWTPPEERIVAAAAEAGFSGEIAGRSITDLEIDFGVLSDPEQQPRSFFYFRDPLPYQAMPPHVARLYSSEDESDPIENGNPHPPALPRAALLAKLKQRITARFPARVRHYAAQWDSERDCIGGLEAFGRMVLEDIWSELDAETKTFAVARDKPWVQVEREALDDFIDDRARDFVGRQAVIARLTDFCISPVADKGPWCMCVTGSPGSGKSALFGQLCRLFGSQAQSAALERQAPSGGVFLLAHAAGASIRAVSVDSMLRRWIAELAAALDTDDVGVDDGSDPQTVTDAFHRLLRRMAARQRVIVLVDALDQFESTVRARHLAWLPRAWPANVRLIVTSIAAAVPEALAERAGVETLPIPPLDSAEARSITQGICARYHRTFDPKVIDSLLDDGRPGVSAWKDPLWAVLAAEELNLLDADDFDRARGYEGRPHERLRQFMLEHIADFPGDIPGLYKHTFERAEKLFGKSLVNVFLGLIAVGRAGWRESDFRMILPRISGESWDELAFAQLRRFFRGHLRRRGPLDRWDFNHAQMRAAVRTRLGEVGIREQHLHAVIADHLVSSPKDDPLHLSETMIHLIASGGCARAAGYYGDRTLSDEEVRGATQALADGIVAPSRAGHAIATDSLCRLLNFPDDLLDARVAARLQFDLAPSIEQSAPLDVRLTIVEATRRIFERYHRSSPDDPAWRRSLSVAHEEIGAIRKAQGQMATALDHYRESLGLIEELAQGEGSDDSLHDQLSVSCERMGDLLLAQGNIAEALESYRECFAIADRLAQANPGDRDRQHSLSVVLVKLGDGRKAQGDLAGALKYYRDGLAAAGRLTGAGTAQWSQNQAGLLSRIGDVQKAQGELVRALTSYRDSTALIERLAGSDPSNTGWQNDLAASCDRIGDILVSQGNLPEALQHFQDALAIRYRLARGDPANADWQRSLSVSNERMGLVYRAQGNLSAALEQYGAILRRLVPIGHADPSDMGLQHFISTIVGNVGDVQILQGNLAGALESCAANVALCLRVAQSDADNADWLHHLAVSHGKLGQLKLASGDVGGAAECFHQSLLLGERLEKLAPDNAGWQQVLAVSNEMLGDILAGGGRLSVALEQYRASLARWSRLQEVDASNAAMQRSMSVIFHKIGNLQMAGGDLQGALASYHADLAIAHRLGRLDPGNVSWQRDLAVSYEKAGDVQLAQRDIAGALGSYRASLDVRESLARSESQDPDDIKGLAVAHGKIGDVLIAQDDIEAGLGRWQTAHAIMSRLAQSNPDHPEWQRDLAASFSKLAVVFARLRDKDKAVDALRHARAIMARLTDLSPENDAWKRDLAILDRQIAALMQ